VTFSQLGLDPVLLRNVEREGYTTPTPIQLQAIPPALAGRDLLGCAQTGTGKTAAFALPMLQRIDARAGDEPVLRGLVLTPTRELASQIGESLRVYGQGMDLDHTVIFGGVNEKPQMAALREGVDIVVATPGRLLDLLGQRALHLRDIEVFVLDEADRMLDMGFLPDVKRVIAQLPPKRQTLFFSATMPPAIQTLANWALNDPVSVEIGERRSPAETVTHAFYPVGMDQRDDLIIELIKQTGYESMMIFTRTKKEADALLPRIEAIEGTRPAALHSDIKQSDRTKALQGFRDGTFNIIVATDIAARGLDISGVTHVINYRVPENPEDYVHRIGRTGRAQKEGDAFTILTADELESARSVEHFIGQKIDRKKLEGFAYNYTALLEDNPQPLRKKRPAAPKRRR
jgi:superfamily II DNA/RNA helicase